MPKASNDIAIIVPYFNTGQYIEDMRASLNSQGAIDMRIVLIDDGSTDDTLKALREWESQDPRVIVIERKHGGQSAARNHGLDYVSSLNKRPRYLMFVDSDDVLAPDALGTLIEDAELRDLDMLEYAGETFYESNDLHERYSAFDGYYVNDKPTDRVCTGIDFMIASVERNDFIVQPCMRLFRTDLLLDNNIRFYEGIIHEDNLFTCICMFHAKRVSYCNEPLYRRRIRLGSTMTSEPSWRNMDGYFRCILGLLELLDDNTESARKCKGAFMALIGGFASAIRSNPAYFDPKAKALFLSRYTPCEQIIFETMVERDAPNASGRSEGSVPRSEAGIVSKARRYAARIRRRIR